ncbi:MAG: tRNA 4-thiouridine(8) synthase ThiI [Firmicutes bacterium]|nr:tRNA 4-thiouridine(8) synthase ThiI [Bacillota bacterium]
MYDRILVRYGDLTIKGKNKKYFISAVNKLITDKLVGLNVTYDFNHDRVYIILNGLNYQEVVKKLDYVTGLYSYSLVTKCEANLDDITKSALKMIDEFSGKTPTTFKIDTKRANKDFLQTSMEISSSVAGKVLRQAPYLSVDVHHPTILLNIEVRLEGAYLYIGQIRGIGGFPVPLGGKALLMLSGGIDSPVSGYLGMKKGMEIECIHFESTPLTPLESVQKVIDLTEILARYAPNNRIQLHLIPFRIIHEEIIKKVPEAYVITIMRRMMYRISAKLQEKTKCLAILTGDSIGQVASQTLESLTCISEVTSSLIIRPLSTYDKIDIMSLARKIHTQDISDRPFSDCCSVYIPKKPVIRPQSYIAKNYERNIDFEQLIETALLQTKTLTVEAFNHFDIIQKGFTVAEALE